MKPDETLLASFHGVGRGRMTVAVDAESRYIFRINGHGRVNKFTIGANEAALLASALSTGVPITAE